MAQDTPIPDKPKPWEASDIALLEVINELQAATEFLARSAGRRLRCAVMLLAEFRTDAVLPRSMFRAEVYGERQLRLVICVGKTAMFAAREAVGALKRLGVIPAELQNTKGGD